MALRRCTRRSWSLMSVHPVCMWMSMLTYTRPWPLPLPLTLSWLMLMLLMLLMLLMWLMLERKHRTARAAHTLHLLVVHAHTPICGRSGTGKVTRGSVLLRQLRRHILCWAEAVWPTWSIRTT
jgi:hypothetical protein